MLLPLKSLEKYTSWVQSFSERGGVDYWSFKLSHPWVELNSELWAYRRCYYLGQLKGHLTESSQQSRIFQTERAGPRSPRLPDMVNAEGESSAKKRIGTAILLLMYIKNKTSAGCNRKYEILTIDLYRTKQSWDGLWHQMSRCQCLSMKPYFQTVTNLWNGKKNERITKWRRALIQSRLHKRQYWCGL